VKPAFDIPRVVIAGASSNVGKTTITAGLIAALRAKGLVVQPFKCGPDYVDPSYHERAAGRPCRNLDTWMLSDSQLLESFARACQDADIAIVEGVMGLYDGSDWHDERGSTAQIAKLLNAPVVLVFDISGSARSAAAGVLGYQTFDPAVAIRGVVLNFAGSEGHALGCAGAIQSATSLPMVGWLPREMQLQIPERHLGLVPGGEQVDSDALIAQMAAAVTARFNVDGIAAIARAATVEMTTVGAEPATGVHADATDVGRRPEGDPHGEAGPRAEVDPSAGRLPPAWGREPLSHPILAVARDEAFCFYYPENLELLVEAGAEIEFFSPLRGERPSLRAAGVYLGGGYPELHGQVLASNTALWQALRDLHAADRPIFAECGGFMVLTQGLTDSSGHTWPMAGLLPGVTRMNGKLAALGYRIVTASSTNLLAEEGESLRGHEFRYSSWVRGSNATAGASASAAAIATANAEAPWNTNPAWNVKGTRAKAPDDGVGYANGNLLASYVHIHFGQRSELAQRLVARLR
jgi:cobyrinic acid a,c-diamide synthase